VVFVNEGREIRAKICVDINKALLQKQGFILPVTGQPANLYLDIKI
jgi:hypothetical protein